MTKHAIVITTINRPNLAMYRIAEYAEKLKSSFLLIGDTKSPADFSLDGGEFYDVQRQQELDFRFAKLCPTRHYARKNIGYLIAARDGADIIIETDDDNLPVSGFDAPRSRVVNAALVERPGWANVYRLFTEAPVWPRGLPLGEIRSPAPVLSGPVERVCPIQQGLADANPDVDAIYRLAFELPLSFDRRPPVILGQGVWCPFNSQNTTFFREAFELTYLPYYCSFRMTDIWRSFVSQRILWECGWNLMFHEATVEQDRNDHDLMVDFQDEVPGYLNNERIRKTLEDLDLRSGCEHISENVMRCYRSLIEMGLVGSQEQQLLEAWLGDMADTLT